MNNAATRPAAIFCATRPATASDVVELPVASPYVVVTMLGHTLRQSAPRIG